MDRYSPLGLAFLGGILATVVIVRSLRTTDKALTPKERKKLSYDWNVVTDVLSGPAWHWFQEYAADACTGELRTGTCLICTWDDFPSQPNYTYFGPFGPGTALFAQVRIGEETRNDFIVATEKNIPKGWKPACIVNWDRMVLTGERLEPTGNVYSAILEMTREEARARELLPRELPDSSSD